MDIPKIEGQTSVTESGQSLGQIQIVTTDSIDSNSLHQQQQQQQQTAVANEINFNKIF